MTEKLTSHLRRAAVAGVASAGMAVTLALGSLGFGTATANADVLDDLAQQYSTGAGAGQVANLLRTSLQLRAQGYRPKPADYQAIKSAMDRNANQAPLIEALQGAVNSQLKQQRQMSGAGGQSPIQLGVTSNPNWAPGNPMQQDDPIFPIPGR
ncbi:hypothetical protein [Mycolicibacterium confluentis]|uniref:Uncharacterized protein n=1 Tax=Mycolicibacterium confluentis TaxID=28047 RepID=A0A7I7XWX4_9MYCO|nr:hypothetical protein [Mycolicibacterium confluentis]MCV7322605.1 hypothetical protein [Mycolicibacterium confluentis]ORV32743.1 hypothetical protein AWB99_08985 [Mycolicibacterium confluentis]BBZ33342.1 hypothetical protein MCNF_19470 [Mycolicibacterium confluentis]